MDTLHSRKYLEYKKKEAGEYSVSHQVSLAQLFVQDSIIDTTRYRVYCANNSCGEFVNKENYETNHGVEYGKCDHCLTLNVRFLQDCACGWYIPERLPECGKFVGQN